MADKNYIQAKYSAGMDSPAAQGITSNPTAEKYSAGMQSQKTPSVTRYGVPQQEYKEITFDNFGSLLTDYSNSVNSYYTSFNDGLKTYDTNSGQYQGGYKDFYTSMGDTKSRLTEQNGQIRNFITENKDYYEPEVYDSIITALDEDEKNFNSVSDGVQTIYDYWNSWGGEAAYLENLAVTRGEQKTAEDNAKFLGFEEKYSGTDLDIPTIIEDLRTQVTTDLTLSSEGRAAIMEEISYLEKLPTMTVSEIDDKIAELEQKKATATAEKNENYYEWEEVPEYSETIASADAEIAMLTQLKQKAENYVARQVEAEQSKWDAEIKESGVEKVLADTNNELIRAHEAGEDTTVLSAKLSYVQQKKTASDLLSGNPQEYEDQANEKKTRIDEINNRIAEPDMLEALISGDPDSDILEEYKSLCEERTKLQSEVDGLTARANAIKAAQSLNGVSEAANQMVLDARSDHDFTDLVNQGKAIDGFAQVGRANDPKGEGTAEIQYNNPARESRENGKGYDIYQYMSENEYNVYEYFLAKDGLDKAEEYLMSIMGNLNARKGEAIAAGVDTSNPLSVMAFVASVGIDQFAVGVDGLVKGLAKTEFFGGDGDLTPAISPTSARAYASGIVRDKLGDDGSTKIFGSSVSQIMYDAGVTTANMAPSILLSAVTGGAGAVVGAVVTGLSAAGNAYNEAISQGYSNSQALQYGSIIGGLEGGLQYLIGGVSALGGKFSLSALSKTSINNLDSAALRIVAEGLLSDFSEGFEEYLQEYLSPIVRNHILGENNEVKFFSEEAAYAFLLACITTTFMEGPGTIRNNITLNRLGGSLMDVGLHNDLIDTIIKNGDTIRGTKSEAYELAMQMKENPKSINPINIGNLLQTYASEGGKFSDTIAKAADRYSKGLRSGLYTRMNAYNEAEDAKYNEYIARQQEAKKGQEFADKITSELAAISSMDGKKASEQGCILGKIIAGITLTESELKRLDMADRSCQLIAEKYCGVRFNPPGQMGRKYTTERIRSIWMQAIANIQNNKAAEMEKILKAAESERVAIEQSTSEVTKAVAKFVEGVSTPESLVTYNGNEMNREDFVTAYIAERDGKATREQALAAFAHLAYPEETKLVVDKYTKDNNLAEKDRAADKAEANAKVAETEGFKSAMAGIAPTLSEAGKAKTAEAKAAEPAPSAAPVAEGQPATPAPTTSATSTAPATSAPSKPNIVSKAKADQKAINELKTKIAEYDKLISELEQKQKDAQNKKHGIKFDKTDARLLKYYINERSKLQAQLDEMLVDNATPVEEPAVETPSEVPAETPAEAPAETPTESLAAEPTAAPEAAPTQTPATPEATPASETAPAAPESAPTAPVAPATPTPAPSTSKPKSAVRAKSESKPVEQKPKSKPKEKRNPIQEKDPLAEEFGVVRSTIAMLSKEEQAKLAKQFKDYETILRGLKKGNAIVDANGESVGVVTNVTKGGISIALRSGNFDGVATFEVIPFGTMPVNSVVAERLAEGVKVYENKELAQIAIRDSAARLSIRGNIAKDVNKAKDAVVNFPIRAKENRKQKAETKANTKQGLLITKDGKTVTLDEVIQYYQRELRSQYGDDLEALKKEATKRANEDLKSKKPLPVEKAVIEKGSEANGNRKNSGKAERNAEVPDAGNAKGKENDGAAEGTGGKGKPGTPAGKTEKQVTSKDILRGYEGVDTDSFTVVKADSENAAKTIEDGLLALDDIYNKAKLHTTEDRNAALKRIAAKYGVTADSLVKGLKAVTKDAKAKGISNVRVLVSPDGSILSYTEKLGDKTIANKVRGLYDPKTNTITVCLLDLAETKSKGDLAANFFQVVKHETIHAWLGKLAYSERAQILTNFAELLGDKLSEQFETYYKLYAGNVANLSPEEAYLYVLEEMFSDAYGSLNTDGATMSEFTEMVNTYIENSMLFDKAMGTKKPLDKNSGIRFDEANLSKSSTTEAEIVQEFHDAVQADLEEMGKPSLSKATQNMIDVMQSGNEERINAYFTKLAEDLRSIGETVEEDKVPIKNAFRPKVSPEQKAANEKKIGDLRNQYGTKKQSSLARNNNLMPESITEGTKLGSTIKSIIESDLVSDWAIDQFKDEALTNDLMSYQVVTDKEAIKNAEAELKTPNGLANALATISAKLQSPTERITKYDTVLAIKLIQYMAENGMMEEAMELTAGLSAAATEAGQVSQAMSFIKKAGPIGQYYYLINCVRKLNSQYNGKIKNSRGGQQIIVDPMLRDALLNSKSEEEREAAMDALLDDIAQQIPPTMKEMWDAWRYLSMLGNLRTHVRNVSSNAAFLPFVVAKDIVASLIESGLGALHILSPSERTKSVIGVAESINPWADYTYFARQDAEAMKEMITGGGKYSIKGDIEQHRQKRAFGKARILNWAYNFNSKYLEKEDWWFLKPHYVRALASYLRAQGVDVNNMNTPEARSVLFKARDYAVLEAKKATFRDFSATAAWLTQGKKLRVLGRLIDALMPFTKTPANVFTRGVIEYSVVDVAAGIYKVANNVERAIKKEGAKYSAAEVIDTLSCGLVGTSAMGLGYLLAHYGLISVGGALKGMFRVGSEDDDDKLKEGEKKFSIRATEDDSKKNTLDKIIGRQDYSLEITLPDGTTYSYTIDWAAPAALPIFVGAAISDYQKADGNDNQVENFLAGLSLIFEPMTELSMLSSLKDTLETVANSGNYGDGKEDVGRAVAFHLIGSYFGQGIPTAAGQIARALDDRRRVSAYTTNDMPWSEKMWQQFYQKNVQGKIPVLEEEKTAYVTAWGKEQSSGTVAQRIIGNFISPGYLTVVNNTQVDDELRRLYEATDDENVVPKTFKSYVYTTDGKMYLTAEQKHDYSVKVGTTQYNLLLNLINDPYYRRLTDAEKAKAVADVYEYAEIEGGQYIAKNYTGKTSSAKDIPTWIAVAQKFGAAEYILYRQDIEDNNKMTDDAKWIYIVDKGFNQRQANALVVEKFNGSSSIGGTKLTDSQKTYQKNWFEDNYPSYYRKYIANNSEYKNASRDRQIEMQSALYQYVFEMSRLQVTDKYSIAYTPKYGKWQYYKVDDPIGDFNKLFS